MDGLKKRATFYPNFFALRRTQNGSVKFNLVLLFVFSIFLLSNDETFKIASMNASSIVAMLMVLVFLLDGFGRGRFVLQRHSFQKPLLLLFLWALISLLISKIDPSKAVPDESYSYVWATGLNSPDWRGVSFLLRLFLSIFAINFIISNVNTEERYFKVINYFIFAYSLVCVAVFTQIILYYFFNVAIGHLYLGGEYMDNALADYIGIVRVGGYVGEPSNIALLLVSGYFLLIAVAIKKHSMIWFCGKFLKTICVIATIDLLFTFSATWITAALISLMLSGRRYLNKKIFIFALIVALGFIFYKPFKEMVLLKSFNEVISLNVRTYSWLAGLSIFKNNIITGAGIGQSVFFMPIEMGNITDMVLSEFSTMRFPPMNTYIQWAAETGIGGLLILSYLFYRLFKYKRIIMDAEYQNIIKFGLGGGLIAVAIAMNAVPDYLYVGCVNFLFTMYVAGLKVFKKRSCIEHFEADCSRR